MAGTIPARRWFPTKIPIVNEKTKYQQTNRQSRTALAFTLRRKLVQLKKRLKKDGLTIEDLTPEQLEVAREEMKERLRIEKEGGLLLDGFFSSMEYIGLVFRKQCKRDNPPKKQ